MFDIKHTTAKTIRSGSAENVCDTHYETGYRYCDDGDEVLNVQNVVKKPGCETFDIDFGDTLGGRHSAVKRKPELTKKNIVKKVPRPPSTTSVTSPRKTNPRRPLKKVDKDYTNHAIKGRTAFRGSRPNSVNFVKPDTESTKSKPTTQGIIVVLLSYFIVATFQLFTLH